MLLVVPGADPEPWPTLGREICDLIEERAIYGPGSLQGEPYVIDPEFRAFIYRAFEVNPKGHPWEGRRRFKRVGLSVRKGLAKCLAPNTPVLLADGREVRADEVRIGRSVLAYSNGVLTPATVTHTEVQPVAPMWRVRTDRGRELTVTGEHPMLVRGTRMLPGVAKRRKYPSCDPDRGLEQWVPASQLIVGDRVVVGLGWAGIGELPDSDAWMLGAIVGDGSPDGRFTSEDPEVLARLGERFQATYLGRYDYYLRGVRPFLREHGLLGCNSRAKRVPAAVRTATPSAVLAFLAGYLDADGWVSFTPRSNGRTHAEIAWGSVNRDLLVDCQSLLAGLGINGTVCESRGTYKGEPHLSWNLAVRDTVQAANLAAQMLEHVTHPRKRGQLERIQGRNVGRAFGERGVDRVVSVERVADGVSIAIEVGGMHTHVTAGLVTHNTEKQALLAFCELHPDGPTRFDGWDAYGNPVGRPVRSPYIPMLAVTVEQVEELAYGALKYIVEEGPDADLFDSSQERIIRLNDQGRADGKALALANSPGSRDGARTTLNCFDEPHRLYLPRQLKAHDTMDANLPKRPLDDPWSLYVGTAGQPGQGSVAEQIHIEALQIAEGKIERPDLFYLYRTDDDPHRDMSDKDERIRAIGEATGPAGEFGPGQFDEIASKWDRPGADGPYLERVWLNRWKRQGDQFFDMKKIDPALCRSGVRIEPGDFITLGFDGARFRDATALVATSVASGLQELLGMWERPEDVEDWEVPEAEVTDLMRETMSRYAVWKLYADPPHWTETVGSWSALWPDQVEEWWTARLKPMAYTLREYREAIDSGSITYGGSEGRHKDLIRHLGNAGRKELKIVDDEGKPLDVMQKQDGRSDLKFDAGMASVLSWKACLDARKAGAMAPQPIRAPRRIY